jgi:hypothetical protein
MGVADPQPVERCSPRPMEEPLNLEPCSGEARNFCRTPDDCTTQATTADQQGCRTADRLQMIRLASTSDRLSHPESGEICGVQVYETLSRRIAKSSRIG